MQAKNIIAIAALTLAAGAASAQTVSAEAWVGAPIAATGAVSRAAVVADLQREAHVAAAPSEEWVGSRASARTVAGTLSRAEVQADLNLWRRAGLESASLADPADMASPAYARQLAAYARARNSGVYAAEVQRVQGGAVAGNAPASTVAQ